MGLLRFGLDFKMDKIEILGKRLKNVAEGIRSLKTWGIGEEILISWLCHKLKISEKKAKQIIVCEEEFFKSLLKEVLVDGLAK